MTNPKISILLATLMIPGLFESFSYHPDLFYVGLILANLILIFTLRTLPEQNFKNKDYWHFLILPFLFLNSSALYLSFLSNRMMMHFLIIFTAIFIYAYLRRVYLKLIFKHLNIDLTNISSLGIILVAFFSFTSIYGLRASLQLPTWILVLGLLVVCFLISYNVIWVNNIIKKNIPLYLLILVLIIIEIGWALFFLPFSYLILGVILTICYYMIIGLTKFHLKETLDRKRLKFYLGIGSAAILIILLTSPI